MNIALIGNPNTGKSTLFNALSGLNARVGNYPGVTVEKKIGQFDYEGHRFQLIDLPGTYSLSPRSADEMVSVRVLLGMQAEAEPVDAVICIVDATHLERNLYLFSQILDMGLPAILVLNLWDEVEKQGMRVDVEELSQRLGVPVVPTVARQGTGIPEIKAQLGILREQQSTDNSQVNPSSSRERIQLFPDEFHTAEQQLGQVIETETGRKLPHYLIERLLLDVHGQTEQEVLPQNDSILSKLKELRTNLTENGCPIPAIEPRVRYQWIRESLQGIVETGDSKLGVRKDRVDRLLTHPLSGPFVFAVLMFLMFQAIYSWAGPLMDGIESVQGALAGVVESSMAPGALRSLVVDGMIAGVGAVVVFLPQIVILFLFIAVLEDCGYMSRAAYIMDRLMTKIGLSGKSFVPLMSSYACAIPGIMATRTIEDTRDRMVTILIAPLMSCSARLPVYLLMINAFVPDAYLWGSWGSVRGLVLFFFYLLGAFVAIPVAWLLKKTWFKGEPAPFVMELPSMKFPTARVVFYRAYERGLAFVTRAGSLIFLVTVLVWAAGYFPADRSELVEVTTKIERGLEADGSEELQQLQEQQQALSAQLLRESFLGQAGQLVEPAVQPLGWDWRLGVGVIASFPAREVIIGTLGTIYSLGGDVDEEDPQLQDRLQSARDAAGAPIYDLPVALSVMVFFALCAQCGATLMVMRRETNSWKWPIFSFTYMTLLAYFGALITYQISRMVL